MMTPHVLRYARRLIDHVGFALVRDIVDALQFSDLTEMAGVGAEQPRPARVSTPSHFSWAAPRNVMSTTFLKF